MKVFTLGLCGHSSQDETTSQPDRAGQPTESRMLIVPTRITAQISIFRPTMAPSSTSHHFLRSPIKL